MQGNPYAAVPTSAGTQPVPGVLHVPGPMPPGAVVPGLTQYATPPVSGYSPGANPVPPTYQPAPPGGIAGVNMNPVANVPPPAVTGGPHPLPFLPQPPMPLSPIPQGFPNPFDISCAPIMAPAGQPSPPLPGTVMTTGPQGYLPGLGYFGLPPAPPPPATAFPVLPGSQAPVAPPTTTRPPAPSPVGASAPPHPFWLHLAWQLLQMPAVQDTLGDAFRKLMGGEGRMQALHIAAQRLGERDLQTAFTAFTSGATDQTRFIQSFAADLKMALTAAGLLAEA